MAVHNAVSSGGPATGCEGSGGVSGYAPSEVGLKTKPCGCRLCVRALGLLPARGSLLRMCTLTPSPTLDSITRPGIRRILSLSVGLGSFNSLGLHLLSCVSQHCGS